MTIEISTAPFLSVKPLRNIQLIVAVDLEGAIGKDNKLPWKNIPGDLPRFKALTKDTTLIMGRKAFESLPGLLPGRDHYVVTSKAQALGRIYRDNYNVRFFPSIECVLKAVRSQPHTTFSIVGGSEIYRQMLPYASVLYITTLWDMVEADVYSKEFKPGSSIMTYFRNIRDSFVLSGDDNLSHAYRTFVRRKGRYDNIIARCILSWSIRRLDKNFK